MHIIFESVLMLFTQNYQNQFMFDETTACQSWLVFLRQCIVRFVVEEPFQLKVNKLLKF